MVDARKAFVVVPPLVNGRASRRDEVVVIEHPDIRPEKLVDDAEDRLVQEHLYEDRTVLHDRDDLIEVPSPDPRPLDV